MAERAPAGQHSAARAADPARIPSQEALRITLDGHVQGVGFRPFVYRLAAELGLTGYVRNRVGVVDVVAAGDAERLARFRRALVESAPPLSRPRVADVEPVDGAAFETFEIVDSDAAAPAAVFVPPDCFMCDDCRRELADPGDRRHGYPFINCTQCGPRYTLIESLPYDRPNTSMAGFPLCSDCEREYLDPADRRFHAEPVACPACGPTVSFSPGRGNAAVAGDAAIAATVAALAAGEIVAVKGIGGYHLLCDARNDRAVAGLRRRKQRPDKPLAVMLPLAGSDGLDRVREVAAPAPAEAELLASPMRPIVLVRKSPGGLADGIAPGLDEIGVFLPYSPLHELLLAAFDAPLVATSGNISGEPVLTDNDEVEARLDRVADAFLHHDRPIVRPADDPVYRRIGDRMRPLRVGRGNAPVELELPWCLPEPVLAVGGHMKNTLALGFGHRVVVSPHIGEMDSPRSLAVFERVANDLAALYGVVPRRVVCDAHPGYTTTRWARDRGLPVDAVLHHHAHASALVAETGDDDGRWLVFAWDGTGYGGDGSLWGGEALAGRPGAWQRVASFRPFRLPGGDRAGREPWRSAAALYWTCGEDWPDCPDTDGLVRAAWQRGLNCPETSAAGRLFDAAAALVTGRHVASFEAQGPMQLEALCGAPGDAMSLPLGADADGVLQSDWAPLLPMLADTARLAAARAAAFHASMAGVVLDQARALRERHPFDRIGLTGGVFQNRVLAEAAVALLERDGFDVTSPQRLPCNDAGLSFGQAAELAATHAR